MVHTLKLIYIDLRNNENPPFSWQAKDVVSARWTQTSKRERKKGGNEEIFWGAALFISHYMREDEERHTDSATFYNNGLHFCFFLRQSDAHALPVLLSVVQNTYFAFHMYILTWLETSACSLLHHSRYAVPLPSRLQYMCFHPLSAMISVITPNHSRLFNVSLR